MSSNKMAVAIFKQPTLTVHKQGTGQVQIYVQGYPPGETLTPTFSRSYPVNASVVLIAHPPTGWAFVEWTGDASGTSPSKIIGLSADKTVTAVFEPINLTVNMDPAGAGSVNVTPPNQTDDEPFTVAFSDAINSKQTIATAYPNVGWAFKEWTGDHTGTENPATIDVNGEEQVTAVFEEVELTVDTEGKGVVHIDPPDITPEEEEYPHTEKYASADPQDPPKVDLVASPTDANWGFKEWTGDVEAPADAAAIEVVMDAAKSVTAVFAQVEVTINVEGSGSVSTAPTGKEISETKRGFAFGAEVAFTATPDPGWAFKEWTGIVTGAEATTTSEPILEDASVTAVFEQIALTVDTQGTGKVTISPPIVTPGVEEYPHTEVYPLSTVEDPQSVTLTAVEVANWGFKEWTGDVEGATDTTSISIDMDAEKSVTAVFEQAVLTMGKEGEGTIGTSPAGEVLSATTRGCRPGDPNVADPITIEAVPAANWGFKEWTGAINTTDNPVEVEMDGDQSVTAVFYQVELTVTKTGEGEVTTVPHGNTEEPTFTEQYAPGQDVLLTAVPADGWFFKEWSGGAVGTSGSIQVDMTEDKTVHALFERIELTVQKQGEGNVTASPPGGQVSVPFTEGYSTGDPVTLQATAAPGWGFKQWIGEVNPSGTTATTTMHSSKTVTAVFAQATLDVDKEGEGSVSVNLPGGVQELPFSETYAYNSTVSLVATASNLWAFDHWEGDVPSGMETNNSFNLPMNSNKSITAVFRPVGPFPVYSQRTSAPSEELWLINEQEHYETGSTFRFLIDISSGIPANLRYELRDGVTSPPQAAEEILTAGTGADFSTMLAIAGPTFLARVVFYIDNDNDGICTPNDDVIGKSPIFLIYALNILGISIEYSDKITSLQLGMASFEGLLETASRILIRKDGQDDYRATVKLVVAGSPTVFVTDSDSDGDSDLDDARPDPAENISKRDKHYQNGAIFNYLTDIGGATALTDMGDTGNIVFAYMKTIAEQGHIEAHELGHSFGLLHRDDAESTIWIMHPSADTNSDHLGPAEADAYDFP
ncbi:MAG: hypothetical protein JNK74_18965 [Candidatus Hydrogenedentes bacterium]|nr:hypothetical protein [Candidatus Hydrogenedentota bacterium]